jgi:flagellar motility protein MotE (MotC chaperone)
MKVLACTAVIAVASVVTPAAAQSIYKYVQPDGRVVYSDKPVPGARLEEELQRVPPPTPVEEPDAARARREANARALNESAAQRTQTLDEATNDLRVWTARLAQAQAALEAGREPREGERTGTVYQGKSQLNDTYWARQRANEAAVAEAQAQIEDARKAINSVR